jgi:hypothetical protein
MSSRARAQPIVTPMQRGRLQPRTCDPAHAPPGTNNPNNANPDAALAGASLHR